MNDAQVFGRTLAAESFGADLRQAIRQIYKAPAFSASVVLLLAAGSASALPSLALFAMCC